MMKKILTRTLALVMTVTALAGCGSDPVADDFEQYLNTDMTEVNANYEEIKEEVGNWENIESDEEMYANINDVVLPLVNESLDMLAEIQPETDEVKAVKEKYKLVMDAYKEAFELLAASEDGDTSKAEEGSAKLEEGVQLLDDYNAALEELAAKYDMEIQY